MSTLHLFIIIEKNLFKTSSIYLKVCAMTAIFSDSILYCFMRLIKFYLLHMEKHFKAVCTLYNFNWSAVHEFKWYEVLYHSLFLSLSSMLADTILYQLIDRMMKKARCQQHSKSIKCNYWLQMLKKPHQLQMFVFKLSQSHDN